MARARVVAFYLPQYHATAENDRWWGEGFTDWVNVKKATPLFSGHNQPRVPLGDRYYDLSDVEALRWQADLARAHGVEGFAHFHYWFNGRRLLSKPTDLMLGDHSIDFPFCLAWANASWSRRWQGEQSRNPILLHQTYPRDRQGWLKHFEYLNRAWSDPRHLRVGGRALFLIYYPHHVPHVEEVLDLWRNEAVKTGVGELHIVAMQLFPFLRSQFLSAFDAIADFQPTLSMFSSASSARYSFAAVLRLLPPRIVDLGRLVQNRFRKRPTFYDYDELWRKCIDWQQDDRIPIYPGAFVSWDNTARYGARARVVKGSAPEKFAGWMNNLVDTVQDRDPDSRLVFLNAWNEWAEGNYLEPDAEFGDGYLKALQTAL